MTETLYAAYGSNLDAPDFARWCEESGHRVCLGAAERIAWLPDRRPAFTAFGARRNGGVLDVVPSIGAMTPCTLHRVGDAAVAALDAKESLGVLYRRLDTVALDDALGAQRIFTYEILPDRRSAFVPPHDDYVAIVRRGLRGCGHHEDALGAAVDNDPHAGTLAHLFAYGTLMPGGSRHHVLREHGLVSIAPATVAGCLVDLGRYPGLIAPRGGGDCVRGVVATVEDIAGLLPRLDRIEGVTGWDDPGSLYWRRVVRAETQNGPYRAWTYLWAGQQPGTPIAGGDWLQR